MKPFDARSMSENMHTEASAPVTLQVSSLLGLCGRTKAALLSGPLHESAGCVKSKQLVRTTK